MVLVGDSPVDAETARRAGVPFVLAAYGFGAGAIPLAQQHLRLQGLDPLPLFEHVFSHYRLHIEPLAWRDAAPAVVGDNADLRWQQLDRIGEMAIVDPTAGGNPIELTKARALEIFDRAMEGRV